MARLVDPAARDRLPEERISGPQYPSDHRPATNDPTQPGAPKPISLATAGPCKTFYLLHRWGKKVVRVREHQNQHV